MHQQPEKGESFLTLRNLVFYYATQAIVDRLDLRVSTGTYLVVLGRSGIGKTTLLKLIAGLVRPDSGDIRFAGQSVLHLPPHQRDVALHFQHDPLYPHKTVRSTLRLARQNADLGADWGDVAERLGISDCLDRRPDALSGGQLRRCGLARTLLRSAAVTLLDEPLTSVDVGARDAILAELMRLKQRLRQPTAGVAIHVTHDAGTAMCLADQIAILGDGRVLQCGDPLSVYNQPACLEVANALASGPLNVVIRQDAQRMGFGTLDQDALARRTGDSFLIRPESVRLLTDSSEAMEHNRSSESEVAVDSIVDQRLGLGCWHVRFQLRDPTLPPLWATVGLRDVPTGGFEAVTSILIGHDHVLPMG